MYALRSYITIILFYNIQYADQFIQLIELTICKSRYHNTRRPINNSTPTRRNSKLYLRCENVIRILFQQIDDTCTWIAK